MGPGRRTRPLDRIGSVKVKFGVLVAVSIVAATLVAEIGNRAGVPLWLTLPVTVAAALTVTQWLARGMTSPLRAMTEAAARMATGDYSRRVGSTSADEVGHLARAFDTMAVDLATADEQRRQLLATVSHELRTPLAAQRALLENLADGVVRPDDAALRSALAQSERLSGLVGDLLDLSRLDGRAGALALGPVAVADLVERAVAEARVGGRDVRFATQAPAGLVVRADAARLAQVGANLLDNAVRHSPAGGTVTVRAGADGPDRWYLEVTDEGPGIPPGRAPEVFTRFWSTTGGGGTGLGLAIASWVCELHGGSITALPPRAGGGARVRAVLPRRPPEPPAGASAPLHAAAGGARATVADPPSAVLTEEPRSASLPTAATPAGGPLAAASVVDQVFGSRWPERGPATAPGLVLTGAAIGALAAAVLPGRGPGLGLLIVLLLAGAVVLRASARWNHPWTLLSAALCLGLGSLVVLRAAGWLTVLALLVVLVLVTTALTGARRLAPMAAGVVAWGLAAARGLPLLSRTLTVARGHRLLWPVLRTAAVSVVALVVFGGLFASGDAVFGAWVARLVPDLAWDSMIFRSFVLVAVTGVVLAGAYLALNPPPVERLALPTTRPLTRTWEWAVPVGLVIAVFAAFVLAQATAMWGGHGYVRRTTGLSYADYVHQGFGQLTVATILTLATVALTVRRARREGPRDRLLLRVLLGTLCALTLVVVASALFRMGVYQQAFGYTVLRVLVDAFELWLGLVVVLVLVAGIRWSGWWLPRAALVSGAGLLLGIGLANPEAWVARQNIERFQATGRIDTFYLASLGPDATPTIAAGLPADLARCALAGQAETEGPDLLSWNLGLARAAAVAVSGVPGAGPVDRTACP